MVKQWFFVRYEDPGFHIRLRLLLSDPTHTAEVMRQMNQAAHYYLQHRMIWNIQIDTYKREVERYGSHAMELSEAIFSYDSRAVLDMLIWLEENDVSEDTKWMWSMRAIDTLLTTAGLDIKEKLRLLSPLKQSFNEEFLLDKPMKHKINEKYRHYREDIEKLLAPDGRHPVIPEAAACYFGTEG